MNLDYLEQELRRATDSFERDDITMANIYIKYIEKHIDAIEPSDQKKALQAATIALKEKINEKRE
ncbi:MAG: hypothetical protein P1P85_01555 [Patescibacteria group bacterium]|nr:hypothetical protein [Patescibacteria group bacterium]